MLRVILSKTRLYLIRPGTKTKTYLRIKDKTKTLWRILSSSVRKPVIKNLPFALINLSAALIRSKIWFQLFLKRWIKKLSINWIHLAIWQFLIKNHCPREKIPFLRGENVLYILTPMRLRQISLKLCPEISKVLWILWGVLSLLWIFLSKKCPSLIR